MVGPILFVAFSGLMVLLSIIFIIFGLVKKKQPVWIGSLVGFVVFSMLTVYSVVNLFSAAVDYAASDEAQEKVKKQAEAWGKNVGNTITGASQGLEATLDEESISKLANKSARVTGSGVKAMAEGFDETVGKTTIFTSDEIAAAGVKVGRADEENHHENLKITLFIEFEKDYNGKIKLTSYDSEGTKMDVSELEINQTAGSEKVFEFPFQYSRPGLSGYCILSKGA